jgi:T-complex protein 1 subunit beta
MQASFVGAMAIADLVKTTLGPKGMVSSRMQCLAAWRSVACCDECPKHARTYLSGQHHPAQDKILQSMTGGKNIMVTNDGATILKSLYVDNAAAKVLVGE